MKPSSIFLCVFTIIIELGSAARILGVFPVASISHQVVYRALMTELARRGHDLTVITPDPVKEDELPSPTYKQIDVHKVSYENWQKNVNIIELRKRSLKTLFYKLFKETTTRIFDNQMKTQQVQELLNDTSISFDLIIIESFVLPAFGFAWRYKAPVIGISSMMSLMTNFDAVGSPVHTALYPAAHSMKVGPYTLYEKFINLYEEFYRRYYDYKYIDEETAVARKYFGEDTPRVDTLMNKMDMLFMNSNPVLIGARPVVPAIVFMGGMHLKPKKKLPEDLQMFLDNSTEGVVYMSLGSNAKSKDLGPDIQNMIINVFKQLPYKVLWKFEESLPNLPDNVKISRWLPQQNLLGHPNIKVFITQGGQQSMEEAIRDEVPLIGIPFIGDQDFNVNNFIRFGVGVGLEIVTLTEDKFKDAIMTVTTDPRYKENMSRLSRLVSDQPESGLTRAAWWTEHVLRHAGAPHLRAPAADVSALQYLLLDVVAVSLAAAAAAAALVYYLLRLLFKTEWLKPKVKLC